MRISTPVSTLDPDGVMADNSTHPILDILQSFSIRDVILAFCLSMVVGLLLGALVYVVLTWMARRQASATITRAPSPRSSGRPSSPRTRQFAFGRQNSAHDRRSNNSLASAAYSFHRQTSSSPIDHADLLGRKDSFRASTFHPLIQCSQIAREAEEGNHGGTGTNSTASSMVTPPRPRPRPNSFWGNSTLMGGSVTQTPPPAYNSVIRAYQETCT